MPFTSCFCSVCAFHELLLLIEYDYQACTKRNEGHNGIGFSGNYGASLEKEPKAAEQKYCRGNNQKYANYCVPARLCQNRAIFCHMDYNNLI